MKRKGLLSYLSAACLILSVTLILPYSSSAATLQGDQTSSDTGTSQANLTVDRIIVKEVGYGYITASDGRIIRLESSTRIFKNTNKLSKMRTAELHYVNGRLATVYIAE